MLHTPICDYFGIEYPILLAGMGGVAMHRLVAAVSNAGGLGVIGAAGCSPEELREEIRRTRELTDKPFAVDLLAPIPDMMRPHMPVLIEEKIKIFVAGLAVPAEFIRTMHEHGMKVVVMCGKVHHGEKAAEAGADVVVAQGSEAGGHTGEIGMMSLVPQMIRAVRLPVLAAGGIAHGSQVAAALTLGAQAAVIGTRFIATPEAQAAQVYRDAIVKARDDSTLRTRCYTGKPCRVIRTGYALEWEREPAEDQAVSGTGAGLISQRRDGILRARGPDRRPRPHFHADRPGRRPRRQHPARRRSVREHFARDRGEPAPRAIATGRDLAAAVTAGIVGGLSQRAIKKTGAAPKAPRPFA